MTEDKYSVIMTAFRGNWEKLDKAVPDIFGRAGLDIHVTHPDELPSELAADLPHDEAERIASRLEEFKAEVCVVPTTDVEGVESRAEDLWYSRVTEHYAFSEVDEMIVLSSPKHVRRDLGAMKQRGELLIRWQYENGVNHEHLDELPGREAVREGYARVEKLRQALSTAYPERRFVIRHDLGAVVSFFQATEDALKEIELQKNVIPEEAWCQHCEKMRPYLRRDEPDPEFPEIEWGDCAVCGREVIIQTEVFILVEPER